MSAVLLVVVALMAVTLLGVPGCGTRPVTSSPSKVNVQPERGRPTVLLFYQPG
jgi:hypothetical protein